MNERKSILKSPAFQSILTSLLCIVLGLLVGYIVLLIINPSGAGEAIKTILLNFLDIQYHYLTKQTTFICAQDGKRLVAVL